jgi:hypothetical protein
MDCKGRRTTTDYMLTNRELLHKVIQVRVYRATDNESEHSLVISKLVNPIRLHNVRANGQHKAKETKYTF